MFARLPTSVRHTRRLASYVLHEAPSSKGVSIPAVASVSSQQQTVLDNGVKVTTVTPSGSSVAQIAVSVAAGSRYESFAEKGAAQFIATTAFKDTNKRSSLRLMRDLENAGVEVESKADRDSIVFKVSVANKSGHVETAAAGVFEAVADRSLDSYVAQDYADSVEFKYGQRCKYAHIKEMVHEAAYGERASLAAHYSEDISTLTQSVLDGYYTKHFHGSNVSVLASGVAHADVVSWAGKYLSHLPKGAAVAVSNVTRHTHKLFNDFKGGELRVRQPGTEDSLLAIAFPIPDGKDGKAYHVLATALKLQSGVHSFVHGYAAGGIWGVYAHGDNTEASVEALSRALKAIKAGASAASIEAAKTKLTLDAHLSGLDGVHRHSLLNADGDYSSVSASDVSAAAADSLSTSKPAVAVLGKTFGVPAYADIQAMLK